MAGMRTLVSILAGKAIDNKKVKERSEVKINAPQPPNPKSDKTSHNKFYEDMLIAGTVGFVETVLFHSADTAKKRIQKHKGLIQQPGMSYTASLRKVILSTAAEGTITEKVASMYKGFGFAVLYKFVQRAYKLGLQPTVKGLIQDNLGDHFSNMFGNKSSIVLNALSGSFLGAGEICLLPLDALKIKYQTNPEAYAEQSVFQIMRSENLWYAYHVTAARNFIGSGLFFGVPEIIKQCGFGLSANEKMNSFQNVIASAAGAICSIGMPNGFDVIKTRMQSEKPLPGVPKETARQVGAKILKQEGVRAFAKGAGTALLMNGPKSTFALFATNKAREMYSEYCQSKQTEAPKSRKP